MDLVELIMVDLFLMEMVVVEVAVQTQQLRVMVLVVHRLF
jgi:hypothetical protein